MTHIETKRMVAIARKSGLLTTDELGKHLKIEGISAEDIEVALAQLSDLGISVIEEVEEETLGSKTLARAETTAVKGGNSKDELDRTDDPVRMYLREMGVVELLSREGEIAIAKRIEAGRDTMIKGLCEVRPYFRSYYGLARRVRRRENTFTRYNRSRYNLQQSHW
jgi:RNA polymerase primary sigma factor